MCRSACHARSRGTTRFIGTVGIPDTMAHKPPGLGKRCPRANLNRKNAKRSRQQASPSRMCTSVRANVGIQIVVTLQWMNSTTFASDADSSCRDSMMSLFVQMPSRGHGVGRRTLARSRGLRDAGRAQISCTTTAWLDFTG